LICRGTLTGSVNGVELDASLTGIGHDNGRVIADISSVDFTIGTDLCAFNSIITILCWTKSKEYGGALNGMSLTGGNFTRYVTVTLPDQGDTLHMIHVSQYVDDTMRVQASVNGTVPEIPSGSSVQIVDYWETWEQVNDTTLHATSQRYYHVSGCETHTYLWDVVVHYDGSVQLPFPQTRYVHDCVSQYFEDTETLHFESTNEMHPSSSIPTLSEWAMIIFAVVIMALMTYVVVRRRRSLRPTTA
jgi:hypothetical protein